MDICRDSWQQCEDIRLKAADTVLHAGGQDGFGNDRQVILMAHSEQERFRATGYLKYRRKRREPPKRALMEKSMRRRAFA